MLTNCDCRWVISGFWVDKASLARQQRVIAGCSPVHPDALPTTPICSGQLPFGLFVFVIVWHIVPTNDEHHTVCRRHILVGVRMGTLKTWGNMLSAFRSRTLHSECAFAIPYVLRNALSLDLKYHRYRLLGGLSFAGQAVPAWDKGFGTTCRKRPISEDKRA